MVALAASHGSRAQFFIGTSGAPTNPSFELSQYLRDAGLPFNREKAEVSAFRNLQKAFVAGLIDSVIPLSGPYDANIDATFYALMTLASPANNIAWQYGPTG